MKYTRYTYSHKQLPPMFEWNEGSKVVSMLVEDGIQLDAWQIETLIQVLQEVLSDMKRVSGK